MYKCVSVSGYLTIKHVFIHALGLRNVERLDMLGFDFIIPWDHI